MIMVMGDLVFAISNALAHVIYTKLHQAIHSNVSSRKSLEGGKIVLRNRP